MIVLAVDEGTVSRSIQNRLEDENAELDLDDATKIVAVIRPWPSKTCRLNWPLTRTHATGPGVLQRYTDVKGH